MAWIIGIDEAGYGPNLGPFVMTMAACRVPDSLAGADPWDFLAAAVCRHDAEEPGSRLPVADSKKLFSQSAGLDALERSVLALLSAIAPFSGKRLGELLKHLCPESAREIHQECWFTGKTTVPYAVDPADFDEPLQTLLKLCQAQDIRWHPLQCQVVRPSAFNALIERWGTKGSVPALSLVALLRRLPPGDEPVTVHCDKHGGRNFYSATLQAAFDDDMVIAHEEGASRSVYKVSPRGRPVTIIFEPRADDNYFCVALASMACKYLRELLMVEFNRFWLRHSPGLKPTAGYPGDARRFWNAIRPAAAKLGIPAEAIWRCK